MAPLDGSSYFAEPVPLTETKADPFSLESLVAWLETQPAATAYCYGLSGDCLLARYFTAMGLSHVKVATSFVRHGDIQTGGYVDLPSEMNRVAQREPHTFGAALDRARTLLAARAGI